MPLGRRSNVLKALLRLEAQGVLDEFDDATHRWDVRSIYNMINQGWVLYGIVGSTNIDPNGQFLRVCVCVCVSYEPTSGLQEMCSSILEDVTYYWKFEILCVWISVQTEKSQGWMDNAWNCKIQSFFPAITGYATPNTIDKIYKMKLKIRIYLILWIFWVFGKKCLMIK